MEGRVPGSWCCRSRTAWLKVLQLENKGDATHARGHNPSALITHWETFCLGAVHMPALQVQSLEDTSMYVQLSAAGMRHAAELLASGKSGGSSTKQDQEKKKDSVR